MDDSVMLKGLRIPLTAYDLLGYLVPGSTMLICFILFDHWTITLTTTHDTPTLRALEFIGTMGPQLHWLLAAGVLFALLSFAYVLGHVVSSVSSLFIERVFVAKGYGYPYTTFLRLAPEGDISTLSGPFYRGLFFWGNAWLAVLYLATWFGDSTLAARLLEWLVWILGGALVVVIVGKFIASSRSAREKRNRAASCIRMIWSELLPYFSGPYDVLAKWLSEYLGTREPFDSEFIDRYKQHFKKVFRSDPQKAGTNNFWFCYLFVREHSLALAEQVENWLRLYAFARNLSTSFFLAFLYGLVWLRLHLGVVTAVPEPHARLVLFGIPALCAVGALAMLYRYYYLYANYYTKFTLRSFVYLCETEARPRATTRKPSR